MEAVEEANSLAVGSCHRLITLLSQQRMEGGGDGGGKDHRELSDVVEETSLKFKRVSSLLCCSTNNNMGTATPTKRVKTGPNLATRLPLSLFLDTNNGGAWEQAPGRGRRRQPLPPQFKVLQFQKQWEKKGAEEGEEEEVEEMYYRSGINLNFEASAVSSTSRSFMSTLSMDGSVGDGSFQLYTPLPPNHKKRVRCTGLDGAPACNSSSKCHCSNKRKNRVRKSIKVPAISNKVADIPTDDYSWRKYGQKPIKGSPHPRGYYKCSSIRGCPARKHVERCVDEPTMLIVTYEGDHNHPQMSSQPAIVASS